MQPKNYGEVRTIHRLGGYFQTIKMEIFYLKVFLQKLVHEHLGFSIWKFINIDKTVLLTVSENSNVI